MPTNDGSGLVVIVPNSTGNPQEKLRKRYPVMPITVATDRPVLPLATNSEPTVQVSTPLPPPSPID